MSVCSADLLIGEYVTVENYSRIACEIHAIRETGRILGTHNLTCCRMYATSEPCSMCAYAISLACIDQMVFGAPEFNDRR